MAKFKPFDVFETEPCGRCGGSGEYSYNMIHGSVCYGCQGAGVVFTKAGRAARERYDALRTRKVAPADVQPGDLVNIQGKWRRIEQVEADLPISQWSVIDGQRVPVHTVALHFTVRGERNVHHLRAESEVTVPVPNAPGLEAMVGQPGVNKIALRGDNWERVE